MVKKQITCVQFLVLICNSKIRAANLSGECKWGRELARGNGFHLGKHQPVFFFSKRVPVAYNRVLIILNVS